MNSRKAWKIAFFHEPAWVETPGGHSGSTVMQDIFNNYFHNGNTLLLDLTISGHAHFYQHLLGGVEGRTTADSGLIEQLVIGAAGVTGMTPRATRPSAMVINQQQVQCYGIFDVTPTSLTGHIYNYNRGRPVEITHNGHAEIMLTKGDTPGPSHVPSATIAARNNASEVNASPGSFTVNLTPHPTANVTVGYTVSGSAGAGVDYARLSGSVTVNSSGSAIISVTPLQDSLVEGNENVFVRLNAGTGYTLGSASTAELTIADANSPPPPPPASGFVLGINFNGGAATIGGHVWRSDAEARAQGLSFSAPSTSPVRTAVVNTVPNPRVDTDTARMLNSGVYAASTFTVNQNLVNGSYNVYLWEMETYRDNFRTFTVTMEGHRVDSGSGIGQLRLGQWQKYGPYAVTVTDRQLNKTLANSTGTSGNPCLLGLEICRINAPSNSASLSLIDQVMGSWMPTLR